MSKKKYEFSLRSNSKYKALTDQLPEVQQKITAVEDELQTIHAKGSSEVAKAREAQQVADILSGKEPEVLAYSKILFQ